MRGRAVTAIVLTGLAATAAAAPSVDTVNGRQVAARKGAEPVALTTSARSAYVVHCAGCHGVDGAGSKVGYVPDLRPLGQFLRLPGGREFVIKVPGVMGSGLTDLQVAEVTNWVLGGIAAASVPAGFAPYTQEEVARARSTPLVDVAEMRRQLVSRAREQGVALGE